MPQPRPVVGRLAPSPTGGLHLGHARTFLVAWLAARSTGGRMILRIEDIDTGRVRPGATDQALRDLRWLGLDWDEGPDVGGPNGPYMQSERLDRYRDAQERLKASELVYPCTCTRSEIARAASAPHGGEEGPRYPGTCAHRSAADASMIVDRPFAWRFRTPPGAIAWDDLILGRIEADPATSGDFVVGRSDGSPAYQLAVVVDDAAMRIDQVIRGDDLVASTPRQIRLYEALGLPTPNFGHLPLVLGPDGTRLAKRDGSIKLATLSEGGASPTRLMGLLATSIGLSDGPLAGRPADFLKDFGLGSLPKKPWIAQEPGELATILGG